MARTCPHCGLVDPQSICSMTGSLICTADCHPPQAGCGQILTPEERHYYGDTCENCVREWGERIDVWKKGGEDPELDNFYDGRGTMQ